MDEVWVVMQGFTSEGYSVCSVWTDEDRADAECRRLVEADDFHSYEHDSVFGGYVARSGGSGFIQEVIFTVRMPLNVPSNELEQPDG